jgi:hypothetical protein
MADTWLCGRGRVMVLSLGNDLPKIGGREPVDGDRHLGRAGRARS